MNPKVHYAIKSFTEVDAEYPGTFSLILSDPTLDRDNEVVDAKCFTVSRSLPDHISMDLDHEMKVLSTVGSGTPSYTPDGSLQVDGTWARTDDAQKARSLVTDKHVRGCSVAYRTIKATKDAKGVRHIVDAELLNGTFTQVPSNTSAKVISSKAGARNSAADMGYLQTAHDAIVSAGADCPSTSGKAFKGFKDFVPIEGSVEALQARVQDALDDCYCSGSDWCSCRLIGVVPDSPTTVCAVIFRCYGCPDMEDDETYQQMYEDDGAMVTLTGMPEIVDLTAKVMPDADAAREMPANPAAMPASTAAMPAAKAARLLALHAHGVSVAAQARVI